MPSVNLSLFTEPMLSLYKVGKYSIRPMGLLQLPLKSETTGEPLASVVEERNLKAVLFSNIPRGKSREEGLSSKAGDVCVSWAALV